MSSPIYSYSSVVMSYTHTQDTASTTWNITHNLGQPAPVVDCWITSNDPYTNAPTTTGIIPESVVATDENNVIITFTVPRTGTANIV